MRRVVIKEWIEQVLQGKDEPLQRVAKREATSSTADGPRWVSALALAVATAWLAVFAIYTADFFVDDAFIGFRYVDNLLSGDGFVFNPGERIEGVTNIGWLAALVPLAYLVGPLQAAKVLGLAVVVLALGLCVRVEAGYRSAMAGHPEEDLLPAALPLLVVSSVDFLYFGLTGMESGFAAALTLLGVWLLLRRPGSTIFIAVLGWFLFLVRPELGLVFPLFAGGLLATRLARWRELLPAAGLWAALLSLTSGARYLYFGAWLPNTFYAKSATLSGLPDRFLASLSSDHLNLPPPFAGLPSLLLIAVGAVELFRRRRRATLFASAVVASGWLFCLYANEDWTELGRYFAPVVPLAFLLFWKGLASAIHRFGRGIFAGAAARTLLLVVLLVLVLAGGRRTAFVLSPDRIGEYPGYVLTSRQLIEPAVWIERTLPADSVIATRRIGAIGYYGDRAIFDYKFGLIEREVARRISESGQRFDNPRIEPLREIWRRRAPDYLLEDESLITGLLRHGESVDEFEIHGIHYGLERRFPLGTENEYWMLCRRLAED